MNLTTQPNEIKGGKNTLLLFLSIDSGLPILD